MEETVGGGGDGGGGRGKKKSSDGEHNVEILLMQLKE